MFNKNRYVSKITKNIIKISQDDLLCMYMTASYRENIQTQYSY